jgi:hypothetical protein
MSKLLTQNSKMKKSSQNGITVVNWTLPAFRSETGLVTCPNAKACVSGCYARSGTYRFKASVVAHGAKLDLTLSDTFVSEMIGEIESWRAKKSVKHLKVRIHDAGDFYSVSYLNKWLEIMAAYQNDPKVSFYAYTKMVSLFKTVAIPANFRVIFSFGGTEDHLIDTSTDFHSKVFESIEALESQGYIDGTDDDMVAALGTSPKVGLVYHGAKNYSNTTWDKVS